MKTLVLGGARSGKSRYAEEFALGYQGSVYVLATAQALDDEMVARIRRHREDRPVHFVTIEEPVALAETLQRYSQPGNLIVVDCLTLWLTNLISQSVTHEGTFSGDTLPLLVAERAALLDVLPQLPGDILLVANEVGLGLVPETPLGRLFRDEAGWLNQAVARVCDKVVFVAAGLPLALKG